MSARRAATAAAALVLAGFAPAAAPAQGTGSGYSVKPGPYRADVAFVVRYGGFGFWRTDYHSTPPNPGHNHDTNDAHDASAQGWALRFRHRLRIPACGVPDLNSEDECSSVEPPNGARGATRALGSVDHVHKDGIYPADDASVSCLLQRHTKRRRRVAAAIGFAYSGARRSFAITAYNPVGTVLLELPSQCPGQGDSIEGVSDNYFGPAFSFDTSYDPDRWFTSHTITIPARTLHTARRIDIAVGDTPGGTPPQDCSVSDPSRQRCSTRGFWEGVLTLSRSGP